MLKNTADKSAATFAKSVFAAVGAISIASQTSGEYFVTLTNFGLSFSRRRESTSLGNMDTRLRGYDNFGVLFNPHSLAELLKSSAFVKNLVGFNNNQQHFERGLRHHCVGNISRHDHAFASRHNHFFFPNFNMRLAI